MFDYILLLLLSLSPAHSDGEDWEARTARMTVLASAIDNASSWATCTDKYKPTEEKPCTVQWTGEKKDLAILLVTKGYWESRFAKNVHEGKCKFYECDPHTNKDGSITHRARTPWQMQLTSFVKKDEWDRMNGATQEATNTAAGVAARILSRAFTRCHNGIYGAISGYAGNMGCSWTGVANRFDTFKKLKAKSDDDLKKASRSEQEKLEARLKARKR